MCKWTKLAIDKVMLRPSELIPNHLNHGLWKDTLVGFVRPKSPSTAQMSCGNLHVTWLKVSGASSRGWCSCCMQQAEKWNMFWGAVSLATSHEQVINKQDQMLQSKSWEKSLVAQRYPWCLFCSFLHFCPLSVISTARVWNKRRNSTLFFWGTGLPCSGWI